jgi:transposase
VRRAVIIMASASGTRVPAIARLVAADEDTVRDVIHAFNEKGLAALDPRWAGGRPRLISGGDIEVIVAAAWTGPEKLGQPFTHWSLRKLAGYSAGRDRPVRIGRERLRQILHARGISFQRTRTWKESTDPDRDAKLDRIEYVTSSYPDRCFAFDQFGPLSIRPCHGVCWAPRKRPARLRATYHRTHGIRYFHGCYSVGDDHLWGVVRERKGADHTLAALESIRAARPGGYRLFVILDNLSANKTPAIRRWAKRENVELCFTPVNASWANCPRTTSCAGRRTTLRVGAAGVWRADYDMVLPAVVLMVWFLIRQLGPSMVMTSQWWRKRSSMAVARTSSVKTWPHSLKALLLVMMTDPFS